MDFQLTSYIDGVGFTRYKQLWISALICNFLGGILKIVYGGVCALFLPTTQCFLKLHRIKNLYLSKLFTITFQIDTIRFFATVKETIVVLINKSITTPTFLFPKLSFHLLVILMNERKRERFSGRPKLCHDVK